MNIFDVLSLIGGLALFLFGMNIMGDALEKRAGNQLKNILEKLTSNRFKGFLLGAGVTAIIQSSSATTVMVVGFVNSGIMSLKQAIGIIMGANVGTTITSWILSLTGIESSNIWVSLLKPTSFDNDHVKEKLKTCRYRNDSFRICSFNVWNGTDVRFC